MPAEPHPNRARVRAHALLALVVVATATWWGVPSPASAATKPARAAADTAQVTIVHGLRGKLVDIYVDGSLLLPAFQPDRITEPTAVPAGPHTVDLREAGSPKSAAPSATAKATLPVGSKTTVVAYFKSDGSWAVATYPSAQPAPTDPTKGRLVVRNTSAVGPIDVTVDGAAAASKLAAPAESVQELAAKSNYSVAATAGGGVAVPADTVAIAAGRTRLLYLVGSAADLTWLTQEVGSATTPDAVGTGNSGLAADAIDGSSRLQPLATVGLAAVVMGLVVMSSRRPRRGGRPALRR